MKPRRKHIARVGIALVALAGLAPSCVGNGLGPEQVEVDPPPANALRVLFIGNSLTYVNDLPAVVGAMADSLGVERPFWSRTAAQPDYALEDHWTDSRTRDLLSGSNWDVVVMQQGPSSLPENQLHLREWAGRFAPLIRNAGAVPALYMVWPESARRSAFGAVSDAYTAAAVDVDGMLFPAGRAWLLAWEHDATIPLYGSDGFHPATLGTYLAALVIVHRLYGEDLDRLPARIRSRGGTIITVPESIRSDLIAAAREANGQFGR